MKVKRVLAVDVGYYATKAVSEKDNVSFPSIVGTPDISQLVAGHSHNSGENVGK